MGLLRGVSFAVGLSLMTAATHGQETHQETHQEPASDFGQHPEEMGAEHPPLHPFFSSLNAFHPGKMLRSGFWAALFGATAETEDRRITAFFDGKAPSPVRVFRLPGAGKPPSGRRYDFWFQQPPDRNVVFSTFDASERSLYFSAGFKRAIRSHLDEPGYRFMATFGMKIREYDPALGIAQSRLHAARMVAGYEWKIASLSLTAMAGASFVLNTTDATQSTHRLGRIGPVGMIEVWQDWGKHGVFGSRFTALFAMADQASRSFYLRLRHGFALADTPMRIGPETAISVGKSQFRRGIRLQDGWRKVQLGVHLSEIPLWQARLGVSSGMEWRENGNPGGYVQFGAYFRY